MEDISQERRTFIKFAGTTALFSIMAPLIGTASDSTEDTAADAISLRVYDTAAAVKARILMEGFPIGNGRIGGLIAGGIAHETISLNEISLWTGNKNPTGAYASDFGAFQALSTLSIDFSSIDETTATSYQRTLDVQTAQLDVDFTSGGINFKREAFCSQPDQILVLRFSADTASAHSGTISLADAHSASTTATGTTLSAGGKLSNGEAYATAVQVVASGGTVAVNGNLLNFNNVDTLTLIVSAGTNYVMGLDRWAFSADNPIELARSRASAAATADYAALVKRHRDDYGHLFNRVTFGLGPSTPEQRAKSTFQRVTDNLKVPDPEVVTLYFQFARYLMISCSRKGGLPSNLQGLWNNSNSPPWNSDYHTDINIQMCYWLVEPANLAECFYPFSDFIQSQLTDWRAATRANPALKKSDGTPSRGWALRVSHNIYGGLGWNWDLTANAWYCRHLFDHYAYTLDANYLRTVAYPVMKEVCQFFQDTLITSAMSAGRLVVSGVAGGWSPEHGPDPGTSKTDGCTYNQEFVWDVVNNTIAAIDALGVDSDFRAELVTLRDNLYLPGISPTTGQLDEWMTGTYDTGDPEHRHLSHLVGLYPGERIALAGDPALTEAARKALQARGHGPTGWSAAWRVACWATLGDGAAAYDQFTTLLQPVGSDKSEVDMSYHGGVYPNLFDAHPPFQIDGNFGGATAMITMIVQSHMGKIILLPALPAAWPQGSITGIRLRGGFEADVAWEEGQLTRAEIRSVGGYATTVYYDDGRIDITPPKQGAGLVLTPASFTCKP